MPGQSATAAGPLASPPEPVDLPPETLLDDFEAFETALADGTGPLAVISDPYAGRESVLAAATDRLDAARLRFSPGADVDLDLAAVRDRLDEGPVVLEDCHHLYRRTVGGFEALEALLDALADVDAPVVTGWTRYSWDYLAAVHDLDRAVATTVRLEGVTTDEIADLVLGRTDESPEFVRAEDAEANVLSLDLRTVTVGGRTVSVPFPAVDRGAIATADESSPADAVFERVADLADGNPGVALALWAHNRTEQVSPADIDAPGSDVEFDRTEAFCLRLLLAKESVRRAELTAILDDADRVLDRLARADVVVDEGDVVRLAPAAVPAATATVERRRIL